MANHDLQRARRGGSPALLLRLLGAIALVGVVGHGPVYAQNAAPPPPVAVEPPPAGPSDVQVLVTLYAWTPWIDGKIPTKRPSASGTVGFGQIFDHRTWVSFVREAEVRKDRFGVLIDYLHFPLKCGISTGDILFGGGNLGLTIDLGTALFLYRAITEPDQYLDIGVEVRVWAFDGDLTLNQGLLPSLTVTRGVAWADPMIGARTIAFSPTASARPSLETSAASGWAPTSIGR
jgi:hypothetical protein